ncbi:MAG: molybdate ABC transporter permease subunit [Sphingomonadaceae bacterium]
MTGFLTADEWEIIALSLKVSLIAIAIILPLAYALAYILARWHFPGKLLLDSAIHLPMILPPVVTGWILLILFSPSGIIGRWLNEALGIVLPFHWSGAALAAAVMALPLMVRSMRLSIENIDRRLVDAARTLGASRWRAFYTITLPLSSRGVLAGTILGFTRSLGEFGATITFASNVPGQTRTLPLAIYTRLQVPGSEMEVARLSLLAIIICMIALVASEVLMRRQAGKSLHVL